MAAPRGYLYDVVINNAGSPISGASVQVYASDGVTAASVFANASDGTTVSNPLTTGSNGVYSGWLAEGEYVLSISATGFTTVSITKEIVKGSNVLGFLGSTAGSMAYTSPANTLVALPIGTSGFILKSNGTVPGWASFADTRIVTGQLASNGSVVAGTGFSASHSGTGTNVITFTASFAAAPTVTATVYNAHVAGAVYVAQVESASTTGFTVTTQKLDTVPTNSLVDLPVHFHVIATI